MTVTIPKGKHRGRPPRLALWWNKTTIRRRVSFDHSCKYNLGGEDQMDTNKLFGIWYLWSPHKDSARFGWRWDLDLQKFVLAAYCYVQGQRIITDLCSVVAHRDYLCTIQVNPDFYHFTVEQSDNGLQLASYSIPKWHSKKIGFPLWVYFGGNQKAPHEMHINIRKA